MMAQYTLMQTGLPLKITEFLKLDTERFFLKIHINQSFCAISKIENPWAVDKLNQ
ncbi:TPA: hypothetical protein I8Y90_001055 [Legionella pneumophila]|nr:hypothetical protein [Legionella pneumophila]